MQKYSSTFKNYGHSYTVKMLDFRDPAIQLNITKACIKNRLKDLLVETNSFKFQINLQETFGKEIKFSTSIHHQYVSNLRIK